MVYNKCNKKIYILLPNLEGGGAEKLSVNLANYWESLGYNIKILLLENKGVLKEQLSQNIKIVDLKSKKIRNLFFQLPKFLKFDTPDILLVSMWPLTSIAPLSIYIFRLKVKVFISEHVNLTESLKNELLINDFFAKIIIKMTFRFTNGIMPRSCTR